MAARTAVVAGTATAVSGRVARRQASRYDRKAEEEQTRAQDDQQYQQQAAQEPQHNGVSAKIQDLAQLHSQGAISDEEFAAAKAKVLGI
jgi:membrane protease subunit (stomatin/prohibitin family)